VTIQVKTACKWYNTKEQVNVSGKMIYSNWRHHSLYEHI